MALCDRCEPKAPSLGIVSISALLTAYGRVGLEHSLVAMWTPASRMTLKGPFIKFTYGIQNATRLEVNMARPTAARSQLDNAKRVSATGHIVHEILERSSHKFQQRGA